MMLNSYKNGLFSSPKTKFEHTLSYWGSYSSLGPYGMGMLTYSLWQGISGAALRESEFVDINTLFNYSEETMLKMAGTSTSQSRAVPSADAVTMYRPSGEKQTSWMMPEWPVCR